MHEVLIAVDGSKGSISQGLRVGDPLSQQSGLPLRIVSIIEQAGAESERREAIEAQISKRSAKGEAGVSPEIEVAVSEDPAAYIARRAREGESLVCRATRGLGAVSEAVVGSVAAAAVRQAGRPLVLAGPELPGNWKGPVQRVMVALDGSSLSEASLPAAIELANAVGAELRLIQVLDTSEMPRPGVLDVNEGGYLDHLANQIQGQVRGGINWDVLHDHEPGRAIIEYCNNRPGSLPLLSTHGRTGLARLTMGSVAHTVLYHATFPVAVMRPSSV